MGLIRMQSKKSLARQSFVMRATAILLLWIVIVGWVSLAP
jgi:hypothetical protein